MSSIGPCVLCVQEAFLSEPVPRHLTPKQYAEMKLNLLDQMDRRKDLSGRSRSNMGLDLLPPHILPR